MYEYMYMYQQVTRSLSYVIYLILISYSYIVLLVEPDLLDHHFDRVCFLAEAPSCVGASSAMTLGSAGGLSMGDAPAIISASAWRER